MKKEIKLPEKEEVLKEAEYQIKNWGDTLPESEKYMYKLAFRRCYEYIIRLNK